jgi:hypothetical protein
MLFTAVLDTALDELEKKMWLLLRERARPRHRVNQL